MKAFLLALLPVVSGLVGRQSYGVKFGNFFSTGLVATNSSNSWIREATTTLILPNLNSHRNGNLALWPGMETSNGNLIQGLALSTIGQGSPCNLTSSQVKWCVVASTLQPEQGYGTPYEANPGDQITYRYVYNNATAQYDQTVLVNGVQISTLSTASGHAQGWGTAIECQQAACGTVPEHHYIKTTLVLNVANPNYNQTLSLNGASGNLVTADGGTTWTVSSIGIQQFTYT